MYPLLTLVLIGWPSFGDPGLRDPGIAHGEAATYQLIVGDEVSTVTETVLVKTEDGREFYEFSYRSDRETSEVRIDRSSMAPLYVHSVVTNDAYTQETFTRIARIEANAGQIMTVDFSNLKYVLRGFPFGVSAAHRIAFIQNEGDQDGPFGFGLTVRSLDTEVLRAAGRNIECYRLEVSATGSGVLRLVIGMFPKTYLWYSVELPHYLVRFESAAGPPGSPRSELLLQSYSGWNQ